VKQGRKKTLRVLKICFAISLLAQSRCATPSRPDFNGKVYLGDSQAHALIRGSSENQIACDDPKFDDFVCMPQKDFEDLINALLQRNSGKNY